LYGFAAGEEIAASVSLTPAQFKLSKTNAGVNMAFQAAKCPQCAGALQVPDDRDFIKCMYCGIDVAVRQAISLVNANEKNYKSLGDVAYDAKNYAEAYDYFTRALEANPNDAWVWQKKGTCAAMLSTLQELRLSEMIHLHEKSFEHASNEADLEVLRAMSAVDQALAANSVFQTSVNHTLQFISVPGTAEEHDERCHEVIAVCESVHRLEPSDPNPLELIVEICERTKNRIALPKHEKDFFAEKLSVYREKLRALKKSEDGETKSNSTAYAKVTKTESKPLGFFGKIFAVFVWIFIGTAVVSCISRNL
jgi:tetratricopeptide (TPR) repeat protein